MFTVMFYRMKLSFLYVGLSMLLIVLGACSKDKDEELNSEDFATGIVELPALRNGANDMFVTHSNSFNGKKVTTFSMEYDKSKKHARWVAFRFDNQTMQQNVNRKTGDDPFEPDPLVTQEYQRVRSDFGAKGYDRGHICASADRLYSREANDDTFFYTNMTPQRNGFNSGLWLKLEAKVQAWGRSCTAQDTLYVVKGGTIDKEEQVLSYIDNNHSKPVPKYYFVALLFKKSNSFKAIAFWLEHTTAPKSQNLADYAISIDELEEKTEIDFFPNLNDKLENVVEASYSVKAWNGL